MKKKEENCWVCNTSIAIEFEESKKLSNKDKRIELNNIINSRNPIEELLKYGEFEMTAIPKEVKQELDKLNLNEEDLEEILKDFAAFNTQEQLKIIEGMLRLKHPNNSHGQRE